MGARTKDLIFWQDKMKNACTELFITTDDGTLGEKGFVTQVLARLMEKENIDYGYRYGNIKPTCPMKDRTGCNNPLSKIVLQIDIKTGTVINEYFGLSEASRKTGLPSSNIYRSCVNNKKTCGGYNWRYKDE